MEGEFSAKSYKLLRRDKNVKKLLIDISRCPKINLFVSEYIINRRYIFTIRRIGALKGGKYSGIGL